MSGEKILVVDDDKMIRDIFKYAFDEFRIVSAASGEKALDILKRPNNIDLIVTDVVMPGLSGTKLVKEIKQINPDLKVVILTGYGSKDIVIEALRSNVDEYIEKPFDIEKVKGVLEDILHKRKKFTEEGTNNIESKIRYAKRFIKRNCDRELSLKDVAKEIFYSPKYFSRIFKERTGKSFDQYRLQLRFSVAKRLLKESSYTVSQIADKVGYQRPDSFMKMFRKFTGLKPSQYRCCDKGKKKK